MTHAAPPPAPSVPGWEILAYLGAGGMGTVWKARRADGTLAAVKVAVPRPGMAAEQAMSLFRREALACLNLGHPNLVRGLDVGTTADGRPFLAMEFVEGETLDALIKGGGPLPEPRVVAIGVALAKALDHAHRAGLVHRDVKPRNVIFARGDTVKLLDLGLVVETEEGGAATNMGTYGFIAPEILAREAPGPRSDLYALGATLAAAATGEIPRRDRSFADRRLPETAGRFTLSPGLRQVIERLLRADPAARYGSAAEVVLDLESVAAGERPLGAILGSGAARAVRRGPWIAAAAVAVVAAAAGVVRLASRPPETAHDGRGPVAPAPVRPAPAAPDPKLEAAKVYLARYPGDFARGRELLSDADTPSLTDAERADLGALRAALEARFARLADEALADRTARARKALDTGDVASALAILRDWPRDLRESPQAKRAAATADEWHAKAVDDATKLAAEVEGAASSPGDAKADAALARAEAALARPPFEGDQRERIERARGTILKAAEEAARRDAAALVDRTAELAWKRAIARHFDEPSPARLRAALSFACDEHVAPRLRAAATQIGAALDRAEGAVDETLAKLRGRPWCGPRGDAMFAGTVAEPPAPEEVYLSPLWIATGGRADALAVAAGGREEARAWLFARGAWADAAGGDGAFRELLRDAPVLPPAPDRLFGDENFARADLTLRSPSAPLGAYQGSDPILNAWALAAAGGPRKAAAPNPADAAAAAAAKTRGRDAFLADDLGAAWTSLTEAERLAPWDAEVSALRGRVLLTGARALPTAPALLLAFSEGRRAWDLDPKMPAGPALAAEAGVELLAAAGTDLAKRARPAVVAACEAAEAMGREDARMLAVAGEWNLDAGRVAKALSQLRRAAAKAPVTAALALALARAEHAAGNDDKARAALESARSLGDGALPPEAAELAKALEKR